MTTEISIAIQNDVELGWMASAIKKGQNQNSKKPRQKPTIFKMPPTMRRMGSDLKDDLQACEPQLVSIGPYHHGKSNETINELKLRLLDHYVSKVKYPSLLQEIKDLEQRARDCYSEAIPLDSDAFLEILLLDGVFLAELLHFATAEVDELKTLIADNMWFKDLLFKDLLLIENQLPFFIVEHLLFAKGMHDIRCIKEIALHSFLNLLPLKDDPILLELTNKCFDVKVDHLLHLVHTWILNIPSKQESSATGRISRSLKLLCSPLSFAINIAGDHLSKVLACCWEASGPEEFVPSATELADAGVKIKMKEANSFLHISFCKERGVLEIPSIRLYDNTYVILRNLIAWEQCCRAHGTNISHYVRFIDGMIDTSKDVGLLYQKRIINRGLGNDEEIASVYNKLSTGVAIDFKKSYLSQVCDDVNSYCRLRWPMWRARLVRDYFSNPWAVISLLAAIILLGLTIVQSVYSILSYY